MARHNPYRVIAEALLDWVSGTASGRLKRQLIAKEAELAGIKEVLEGIREEIAQTRGMLASARKERELLLQQIEEHKTNAEELQKLVDAFRKMNDEFDTAIGENPHPGEGGGTGFEPSGNQPAASKAGKKK